VSPQVRWPGGARFAFTVFDDTDLSTIENGPPVYDLLTRLGILVTKSVWPVAPQGPPRTGGSTCDDPEYLAWVLRLQAAGHEIGYHNASDFPSKRGATIAALDRFRELFGHDPRIGADHSGNLEALYWGGRRLSGLRARAYRRSTELMYHDVHEVAQGHDPRSEYYWGDVCRDRIDYWRNFSFTDVNVLRACPQLPYHDPARPLVNWWFASTFAPRLQPFLAAIAPANLDRLEAEGGASIIYTHFGVDFAPDGVVDPRLEPALAHLASRNVWLAPASTVLDHLRGQGDHLLTDRGRSRLENRWVADQVRTRAVAETRKILARRRS